MSLKTSIAELAKRLKPSQRVSVVTGAGVSAASGIPTFRDAEGLWGHYNLEDLATPEAFARQPELVWKWYDWRRQRIATCQPNQAHKILAKWSGRYSSFKLLTQNVDGLHEKSGTKNVLAGSTKPFHYPTSLPDALTVIVWRDQESSGLVSQSLIMY